MNRPVSGLSWRSSAGSIWRKHQGRIVAELWLTERAAGQMGVDVALAGDDMDIGVVYD